MARYSDLNLDFVPHPMTGDVTVLTDMDALKRSVRNLVLTSSRDRKFRPEIDAGIHRYLFEPMTSVVAVKIQNAVRNVVKQFEPRVELLDVAVVSDDDRNSINISILFRPLNVRETGQVNLTLERSR